MQNAEQKTALIAMSGGVDSSIAAYLMRQADFRCMGTTMRLYRNEDLGACNFRTCCSEKDIEDASEVAFQLDIPYEVLDFTLDFQEKIIGKFVRTYEAGGTPNPCIDCNRFMKFDKLLDFAEQHGLYYVVTGHYARIEQDEQTGRWLLKKGVDAGKDQSYVLYFLNQDRMARILELTQTAFGEFAVCLHGDGKLDLAVHSGHHFFEVGRDRNNPEALKQRYTRELKWCRDMLDVFIS